MQNSYGRTSKKRLVDDYTIGFIGIILFITFVIMQDYSRLKDTSNWPTVEGYVLDRPYVRKAEGRFSTEYYPYIKYVYQPPGGKSYTGQRIYFSDWGYAEEKDAQKFLDSTVKNKKVTVYYNPENHTDSILVNGYNKSGKVILMLMYLSAPALYFLLRPFFNR